MKRLLIALILTPAITAMAQQPQIKSPSLKLKPIERLHRNELQDEADAAQKTLDAVQETLNLFLATPVEKRLPEPEFTRLIEQQRALLEKCTEELRVAQNNLSTFDKMLADPEARKLFNKTAGYKGVPYVSNTYSSPRLTITITCKSYRSRYYSRTTCTVY